MPIELPPLSRCAIDEAMYRREYARSLADPGIVARAQIAFEPMTKAEYGRLLNELLELKRAGARLLAAYADELPSASDAWAWACVLQRDEARYCSVLIHLLLEDGIEPSVAVGDFYRKGIAIRRWRDRLRFLARGQQSAAERIDAALPRLLPFIGRRPLQTMYESQIINLRICERHLPAVLERAP